MPRHRFVHQRADISGPTLCIACFHHHTDIVALLLQHHADPRVVDRKGRRPLHVARGEAQPRIAAMLEVRYELCQRQQSTDALIQTIIFISTNWTGGISRARARPVPRASAPAGRRRPRADRRDHPERPSAAAGYRPYRRPDRPAPQGPRHAPAGRVVDGGVGGGVGDARGCVHRAGGHDGHAVGPGAAPSSPVARKSVQGREVMGIRRSRLGRGCE